MRFLNAKARRPAAGGARQWRQRARPCFGTFLTIKVRGVPPEDEPRLFADGFALAQRLHDLMSRQSPVSDVSAIARLQPGERLKLAPETAAVLRLALRLAEKTAGAFDPVFPGADADWRALHLDTDDCVRVDRPLSISLDGIAKGYAADQLCDLMIAAGVDEAIVDAGGDLALHCLTPQSIGLRDPRKPGRMAAQVEIARGGVASSGGYGGISELWRTRGKAEAWPCAVSITAPSCAIADALTKAIAARPALADDLPRWNAAAYVFKTDGA